MNLVSYRAFLVLIATKLQNSTSDDVQNLCILYALGRCDVSNYHSQKLKKGGWSSTKVCEEHIKNATRKTFNFLNLLISQL
jgi:hypothetical protein